MEVGIIPPLTPYELLQDPMFRSLMLPFVFVLGACMGSFFNVCIYRIPLGLSLSTPPSHCYRCGRPVRWFDNIPLISYWVLGGHCRHCGASFSIRYFLIELLTALLFTATYLKIGPSLALLPALVFLSLLIIAAFTDIDHWIIPDRISLGGGLAGLVLAMIWPVGLARGNPLAISLFNVPAHWGPFTLSLAGAAAGFLSLWLIGVIGTIIFRKEAMGFGDVKLFAMFGAFCGVEDLIYILILASLTGTVIGVVGLLRERFQRKRPVPMAVAPLTADPLEAESLAQKHPLGAEERQGLLNAINHPGPVGAVRHHLPFGPSLAIAAFIVYLYGTEISLWFYHFVTGQDPAYLLSGLTGLAHSLHG